MSIKFKLTCETCRRHVEHQATAGQYQKLLQKLRCTFPCPRCSTLIQVEMMGEGLSYSTLMPPSGAAHENSDLPLKPRAPESPLLRTDFPVGESNKTPFSVPAEDSIDGPVSHVPFLPLDGEMPGKPRGSVTQRFFQWYNKQPMLIQWVVLSPLLMLLILLVLWKPNRDAASPAIAVPAVEESAAEKAAPVSASSKENP